MIDEGKVQTTNSESGSENYSSTKIPRSYGRESSSLSSGTKFPYYRKFISVDLELNLYDEYNNEVHKFDDLVYLDKKNIARMRLSVPKIGLEFDPTVTSVFREAILGIVRGTFEPNFDNLTESLIHGKSVKNVIEFRASNINSPTKSELRLREILHSRQCRSYIKKFCKNVGNGKVIRIIEQGLVHYQDSFYLLDFVLDGFRGRPVAIELDGYHHLNDDQLWYDIKRDRYIQNVHGIEVYRILNSEFEKMSDEVIIKLIGSIIKRSSRTKAKNGRTFNQFPQYEYPIKFKETILATSGNDIYRYLKDKKFSSGIVEFEFPYAKIVLSDDMYRGDLKVLTYNRSIDNGMYIIYGSSVNGILKELSGS